MRAALPRGLLLAGLLVLAGTPAEAQTVQSLAVPGRGPVPVVVFPVGDGAEGQAPIPFRLDAAGEVYVKLLPVPGNPVHDGLHPNGTLDATGEGATGWWVELAIETASGVQGLGAFVDGRPSRRIALPSGADAVLQVRVHAPAAALVPNATWTLPVVLAVADSAPGDAGDARSGGVRDAAVAIRLLATVAPVTASDDAVEGGGHGPSTGASAGSATGAPSAAPLPFIPAAPMGLALAALLGSALLARRRR